MKNYFAQGGYRGVLLLGAAPAGMVCYRWPEERKIISPNVGPLRGFSVDACLE